MDNPIQKLPRVAALLVRRNGKEISTGINKFKTHPLQAKFGRNNKSICLHAEIDAIVECCDWLWFDELKGSIMYIARVKRDGSLGLAKPCSGCFRALVHFNIKEVYWTENEKSNQS